MTLLLNDFGRYSFIAQLARELAKGGQCVGYSFCASQTTTPEGSIARRPEDPRTLSISPIQLRKSLNKYSLLERRRQEIEYGEKAADLVKQCRAKVVLSANTPLDAQSRIWKAAKSVGAKRVFWLQDIIGLATQQILRKKLPVLGQLVGAFYLRLEKRLLLQADRVVVIAPEFKDIVSKWGVDEKKIFVVENWAPLDEISQIPKDNDWSRARGLHDRFLFLYSGTLSLKHNPSLLLELARAVEPLGAQVMVRSQGNGADWLRAKVEVSPQPNLMLEGYGPYSELSAALSSADVLVAVLEPGAGAFSVPSKVLTYLAAGKPILLGVPPDNLAARIVVGNEAGYAINPTSIEQFVATGKRLVEFPKELSVYASNARRYAERTFDIQRIAEKFREIIAFNP